MSYCLLCVLLLVVTNSLKQSHNSDTEINTLFVTFIFLSIICIKECVVGFNSQIQNRCYLSAALIILLLPARGYFGLKAVAVLPAFNPKILQWLPAAASDSHATESINIKQESKKKNLINTFIKSIHVKDSLLLSLPLVRMGLIRLTKATVAKHNSRAIGALVRIETLGQWKGTSIPQN